MLATLLYGCSFTRGDLVRYPTELHKIALETASPYDDFSKKLTQRLKRYGAEVSEHVKPDRFTIQVLSEKTDETILTIALNARIRQIQINYTIVYQMKGPLGEIIVQPRNVEIVRTYNQNMDNLLGTYNDRTLLEAEMHDDAVTLILLQISAPEINKVLKRYQQAEYYEN